MYYDKLSRNINFMFSNYQSFKLIDQQIFNIPRKQNQSSKFNNP
jgi:hypothetical protein